MGLLQDLQTFGMTGSKGTCEGGGVFRDCGNGGVFPDTGNASGADSGRGGFSGVIGSWPSSHCDAPQFLQNFAEGGITAFPHS